MIFVLEPVVLVVCVRTTSGTARADHMFISCYSVDIGCGKGVGTSLECAKEEFLMRRMTTTFSVVLIMVLVLVGSGRTMQVGMAPSPIGREVTVTSALWIPLEGQVQVGDDTVTLSGKIHIRARVAVSSDPTAPVEVEVHINLAEGKGVGISGLTYRVVGSLHVTMAVNNNPGYLLHILMDISLPISHGPQEAPPFAEDHGLHNWLTFDGYWHLVQATAVPCRDCRRPP